MLRQIERFDAAMAVVIVALVVAIGIVVMRGDQVGIDAQQFGPLDVASSRSTVQITFGEPIDPQSIPPHFDIQPPLAGKFSTANNSVFFQPNSALQPQQSYQVTVHAGLTSNAGRTLKRDITWQFRVRSPRIVYLGADANLYATDPAASGTPQKLTDSQREIGSYDVAPDGNQIVYAEVPDQESSSLFVLDLATNTTRVLYRCDNAFCANPVWRPDGGAVAFDLVINNGSLTKAPRVWIFDVAANVANVLFKDNQSVASLPRWSPDGKRMAVTSASENGIIVHDFASDKDTTLPTREGETANFSPDGNYLFFRKVASPAAGTLVTHLVLVDLSGNTYTQRPLIPDSDPGNDVEATWRGDSKALLTTRRSPLAKDAKLGSQFYSIDVATGAATALYTDSEHRHHALVLSPTNDALLFQRTPVGKAGGAGLWTFNLSTNDLKQVTENGTDARWLP